MAHSVVARRHDLQIVDAIVLLVTVLVVNDFMTLKLTQKVLFHHLAMLQHRLP